MANSATNFLNQQSATKNFATEFFNQGCAIFFADGPNLQSLRPNSLGDWLSPRIPGALLLFMCEVVVVRYFCFSGLIEYDKSLSLISFPKRHPKSTQSIEALI